MSCITSCLKNVFCCGCFRKKKLHNREAYSVSEAKVHAISDVYTPANSYELRNIVIKKVKAMDMKEPPVDRIDRVAHNRFISTDVISIQTALKE